MEARSLKCFGVGDGWPCADRNHSSFLYQLGSIRLLMDCGEPLSRSYAAAGLSPDAIDRILISHTHFDHIGGFFMMMQGLWLERRTKPLPVHMPADSIEPVRQMLRSGYIFEELFHFTTEFVPLRAGQAIQAGGATITPFPTSHLEQLRKSFQSRYPQSFEAFAFLVEHDGKRIAHSADLGAVEDLAPLLTDPVDLLVCELAHFRPSDLFRFLHGRPIARILFMHVGRGHWARRPELEAAARDALGGIPFSFAHDGEEVSL